MPQLQNKERNRELIRKRRSNPTKWTWGALAKHYKISRPRAVAIFQEFGGLTNYPQKNKQKVLTKVNR